MRPGYRGLWISPDASLENRVSTLRESGVLKDLFEDRWRWIAGSAGKSVTRIMRFNFKLNSMSINCRVTLNESLANSSTFNIRR